jgi:hypothetical protein
MTGIGLDSRKIQNICKGPFLVNFSDNNDDIRQFFQDK